MMKRRISDLLDGIREDSVELEQSAPLSSRRIKELTMEKIAKKRAPRRVLSKVLLAAATIVVLTMTALSAEELGAGDWFRDILAGREENEIKLEEQLGFIDDIGQVYQQSMTSEGTTITPIAGYGDENVFYLRLKVEGPEGTLLPDGEHYGFHGSWEQRETVFNHSAGLDHGVWTLPDSDPKDNVKEFLICVTVVPGTDRKLNDGSPLPLHIYGLYKEVLTENGINDFQKILPGEFMLDLSYFNRIEMVELDVKGLSYHRNEVGTQIQLNGEETQISFDYTVTLSSMKISPLSICWTCDYEMSDPTWKAGLDFQVVMKDGTEVSMRYRGSGYDEDHPLAAGISIGIFDVPIDLTQVNYILIGGEHKVYLPETDA